MTGNAFLTLDARRKLAARTHRLVGDGPELATRCPNDPCPTCDRLPGGWAGWCHRCGAPHEETGGLCNPCERLLFWQETFW